MNTEMPEHSGETEDDYEVLAVRYATRLTRNSLIFLNFHFYEESDESRQMDFFFWILRNSRRTIIVDTGFTPEVGERRGRAITCAPAEALQRLGIDPESVEHVVLTHAHYDHTGNVGLFPSAQVVISARELEFWTGPYAGREQFAHDVEAQDMNLLAELSALGRITRVGESHRIAPNVDLIEVGGHTPGQLVVVVHSSTGSVILASDALHFYDELEHDRPFTVLTDLPGMYRSLDQLRELRDAPGAVLVAGHDPDVMRRFPPLDPADPGLGVRVA